MGRMGWLLLVLSLGLLGAPEAARATIYYLNPASGLDGNNGTSATAGGPGTGPWKTMVKVKNSVQAGDTVRVIAGTYTAAQYKGETGNPNWTHLHRLGTPNNVITILAHSGPNTVIFDGQFTVYWQNFRAGAAYAGHYIVVRDLTFHHYAGAGIGVGDVNGVFQSHHLAVLNCTFQNFTSNQSGAVGTATGNWVIFKGNRFINIGDPTLGGDGLPDSQHAFYLSHDSHFLVADQNYMEQISGFGIHGYGGFVGSGSGNWIIRRNTIVNTWSSSITYAGDTFSNIYTYNNTLYNAQVPFSSVGSNSHNSMLTTHGGGGYTNMIARNNIGLGFEVHAPVWADSVTAFPMNNDYNLWYNQLTVTSVVRWNNIFYTLAGFIAAEPGAYESHSVNAFPSFTDVPGRNFQLAPGSPAIDTGTTLTTTVGTSGAGSSTTLVVADAGYFHDGFGLGSQVPGDTIQVGSPAVNPPVLITAVNYGTKTLTLQTPITWTSGQAVSLPYNGSAPDMGALESSSSGGGTVLPPPTNLRLLAQ